MTMARDPGVPAFLAILAVLVIIGLVALGTSGRAHSFYPLECCSDRDCWPMGDAADAREPAPVVTSAGWKLSDGSIVPFNQARASPDGRFHVCRQSGASTGSVIRPEGRPVCLFTPQQSF
jgi:hypothetical protein